MPTAVKKTFDDKLSLSNRNLQKILTFYLFECPVPDKSFRGNKFIDYGIRGSASFGKLKQKLLTKASPSLKVNYKPCKITDINTELTAIRARVSSSDEYCVFHMYSEKIVMESLFSLIRNSFAHGSFRASTVGKQRFFFLTNIHDGVKAEMVLREQTLLEWIDCIKSFP